MAGENLRQLRVLHLVSSGGVAKSLQQTLFMPLLTRLPKQRVKSQVACLSPGAVPAAVLRQQGVPVHDLALSRRRFALGAFKQLVNHAKIFRPDVIQAWGHTAQILSIGLRKRCAWSPKVVWTVTETTPLPRGAGFIDRQKLKYAAKFAAQANRVVYASEASAAQHRRVSFPEDGHAVIPPGLDATRFKPDFHARVKYREQLNLPQDAFVVGMVGAFQPEFDHATLLKGVGELIKTNPHVYLLLAGHGIQRGNAPLMAMVGGGTLGTRTQLLGEISDVSAFYNACDVACSSALTDTERMSLVTAMLCGVPCVATGMGAQGEVIGQFGVAIEPGSPQAFIRGINRIMQLTPEKRTFMAQNARKHALENFVYVRSLQKYLQVYYDLIGRESLVEEDVPTPEVDLTLPVRPAMPVETAETSAKRKKNTLVEISDPDSLENLARVPTEAPKQDVPKHESDVLSDFEIATSTSSSIAPPTERVRAAKADEDHEDLLAPDLLAAPVKESVLPAAEKPSAGSPPVAIPRPSTRPPVSRTIKAPEPVKDAPERKFRDTNLATLAQAKSVTRPSSPQLVPVSKPVAAGAASKPTETSAASKSADQSSPFAEDMIDMPDLMIDKAVAVSTSTATATETPPATPSSDPSPVSSHIDTSSEQGSTVEERSAMQLELLPDPPSDQKLAAGS
ncbi:MAG TPA: glycosyltransferase [Steroidobacteraceae bacterium]|nr:glycosyltransferase [Steroidobacteraceae bacterium]